MKQYIAIAFLATTISCTAQAGEDLWKLNEEGQGILCSYFPPSADIQQMMIGRDVYWAPKLNQFFVKQGDRCLFASAQYDDKMPAVQNYEGLMTSLQEDAKKGKPNTRPSQKVITKDLEQKVHAFPVAPRTLSVRPVEKAAADSITQVFANTYQTNITVNYNGMHVTILNAKKVVNIDNRGGTTTIDMGDEK